MDIQSVLSGLQGQSGVPLPAAGCCWVLWTLTSGEHAVYLKPVV